MFERSDLFIGGEFVAPSGTRTLEVHNPGNGALIGRVPAPEEADIDRAVAAARTAFDEGPWPRMPLEERLAVLERLAELLQARGGQDLQQVLVDEMGVPLSRSLGQTYGPPAVIRSLVGAARAQGEEGDRRGGKQPSVVVREPAGVVAAIVPWNGPLFVMMAKMAAALAAGCTVVGKPAEETPLSGYILAECLQEAGFPPGVVSLLAADREVSEALVRHAGVDVVSFTGSTPVGRKIGAICGEQLKRVQLELGGKSAAIVLDDADIDAFATTLMNAGLVGNTGQMCMALTRVLVSRDRHDEVVDAITAAIGKLAVGDPLDPATDVGPLISERQRDRVEGYIALGIEEGATVAAGGGRPDVGLPGWYVEPTLFTGVTNDMRIAQEEIFGPVICVIPYHDVDDAVRIANNSPFGLDGSVFTADVELGWAIARRIRTGTININDFRLSLETPFGGFKASGIGREYGPEGLSEFTELKTINVPA